MYICVVCYVYVQMLLKNKGNLVGDIEIWEGVH